MHALGSYYLRAPRLAPADAGLAQRADHLASLLLLLLALTPGRGHASAVALSPAEERATFALPPGFSVELVSSEVEGVGKPVTVVWDAAGRMWTMTALEYPVDANEAPEVSKRLFAEGGRDRALVFDHPERPGPQRPRVFAEGFAIPLGLLPYGNGAFIQYGRELRFYEDTGGDGRADRHETVLSDFGVEDSHLFIHQLTRLPGDWIFMSQGANVHSMVRTREGPVVDWRFCKAARMRPDGSRFELISAGPNNIWGLAVGREGELYIQEANDMGWPVVGFQPYMNFSAIGDDRLRPYAPFAPPATRDFSMGGTGLSGLALAEDRGAWPAPWVSEPGAPSKVVYLANPITNRIQAIRIHAEPGGGYRLEKLPDFLVAGNPWFRPVAVHFGPDGAMYIVDWYNKIISHNEVPRNHPERDRTRGRIWRVRHAEQPPPRPVDFTRLLTRALPAYLGSPSAWEHATAWQQIVDRKATTLAPELEAIAADRRAAADRRLGALWALEGLARAPVSLLASMAEDGARNIRREALRAAGTQALAEADVVTLAQRRLDNPDAQVRAEAIRTLGLIAHPGARALALLARFGREPRPAHYERSFERYLARWALERHPEAVSRLLDSPEGANLAPEARLLAALSLPPADAAPRVARLLASVARAPVIDELGLLAGELAQPVARQALGRILTSRELRAGALASLADAAAAGTLRTPPAAPAASLIARTARAQAREGRAPEDHLLLVRVARVFRLAALESHVATWLSSPARTPDEQVLGLQAMRECGAGDHLALLGRFATAPDEAGGAEAVTALAKSASPAVVATLAQLWASLPAALRKIALDRIASSKAHAPRLLAAVRAGKIPAEDLDGATIDKLGAVVSPDHPLLVALLARLEGLDAAQARELGAKFDRLRALAARGGNTDNGHRLFATTCGVCHQIKGQGGRIGPDLSGAGAMGTESLLRNVLAPNAKLEAAYYRCDVELASGDLLTGFLVNERPDAITLRPIGADDRTIRRADIRRITMTRRSLMPEGLLDGLRPDEIGDLFAYLATLR